MACKVHARSCPVSEMNGFKPSFSFGKTDTVRKGNLHFISGDVVFDPLKEWCVKTDFCRVLKQTAVERGLWDSAEGASALLVRLDGPEKAVRSGWFVRRREASGTCPSV